MAGVAATRSFPVPTFVPLKGSQWHNKVRTAHYGAPVKWSLYSGHSFKGRGNVWINSSLSYLLVVWTMLIILFKYRPLFVKVFYYEGRTWENFGLGPLSKHFFSSCCVDFQAMIKLKHLPQLLVQNLHYKLKITLECKNATPNCPMTFTMRRHRNLHNRKLMQELCVFAWQSLAGRSAFSHQQTGWAQVHLEICRF